jgi:twitching motility protein PilI
MAISALQSLELIERLHAYDSVVPPAQEEQCLRFVGTSIGIAGIPFLVEAGELEEIIETPSITTIPGTKAWALGVAAYKGGLLPIISGDVLFRKRAYAGRERSYCMVINRPGVYYGITLSQVKRDLQFPVEERILDREIDEDFSKFTLGGFEYEGEFMAVLDIDKLVADEDLANASAAQTVSK